MPQSKKPSVKPHKPTKFEIDLALALGKATERELLLELAYRYYGVEERGLGERDVREAIVSDWLIERAPIFPKLEMGIQDMTREAARRHARAKADALES
jgi:hypothetical protein